MKRFLPLFLLVLTILSGTLWLLLSAEHSESQSRSDSSGRSDSGSQISKIQPEKQPPRNNTPATREILSYEELPQLRFIHARSKVPLSSVDVFYLSKGGHLADQLVSDKNGELTLPRKDDYFLSIRLPGFANLQKIYSVKSNLTVIPLHSLGSLRINFYDEFSLPVEGIKVGLLPPLGSEAKDFARVRLPADNLWFNAKRMPMYRSMGLTSDKNGSWLLNKPAEQRAPIWLALKDDLRRLRETNDFSSFALAPEFTTLKPRDDLEKTSQVNGQVEWNQLPAMNGYRWLVMSDHQVKPEPPYEIRPIEGTERGFIQHTGAPSNLSGEFAIAEGEIKSFVVQAYFQGGVRGILDFPMISYVENAEVALYKVQTYENKNGRQLVSFDEEKRQIPDKRGIFEFQEITPGPKILNAHWIHEKNVYFASKSFELQEGEFMDLGLVPILDGHPLEIRSNFTFDNGRIIDHAQLFPKGKSMILRIILNQDSESLEPIDELWDAFEMEAGTTHRVHGLAAGNWKITVTRSPNSDFPKKEYAIANLSKDLIEVQIPDRNLLEINLRVHEVSETDISIIYPNHLPPFRGHLYLLSVNDGERYHREIRPRHGQKRGPVTISLGLKAGEYEAIFVPNLLNIHTQELEVLPNYYHYSKIEISGNKQKEIELDLSEGAIIRGQLRDSSGNPLLNSTVFYRTRTFRDANGPIQLYVANTDEKGNFLLYGVVPGLLLSEVRERRTFTSPAPGQELSVVCKLP